MIKQRAIIRFNLSVYLLSGSADDMMKLLEVFNHECNVYKVSFAKNPSFAIFAGQDYHIKIWQINEAIIKNIQTILFSHKGEPRVIIHKACRFEDERELTCFTHQHILQNSMEILECQRKMKIFERNSILNDTEEKVIRAKRLWSLKVENQFLWIRVRPIVGFWSPCE